MQDDIYIRFLKFALSYGEEGFSYNDFRRQFGEENEAVFSDAVKGNVLAIIYGKKRTNDKYGGHYYILSFDGRFKLLEHQELKEARSSSKQASIVAIFAVCLSIATGLGSIYYAREQLSRPVTINSDQINELRISIGSIKEASNDLIGELRNVKYEITALDDNESKICVPYFHGLDNFPVIK